MQKKIVIIAAVVLSSLLAGCGQDNNQMNSVLAMASQTAKRNGELEQKAEALGIALQTERTKNAGLTAQVEYLQKSAQAERVAKWRARNEVTGAQKVAKSATLAAHSVGVKQASEAKKAKAKHGVRKVAGT